MVIIRELSSLRQFRRRRRNGVLSTVVALAEGASFMLEHRVNLIGNSAFDAEGMIGFLNGRRCRRVSSVCEAESEPDATAMIDD